METLRIQPIQGIFLSASVNGHTVNVWKVNPDDGEYGTDVIKEDAIKILSAKHPVACLTIIKDEKGKIINQLSKEELEKIQKAHEAAMMNAEDIYEAPVRVATDSNLEKLVQTQDALIKTQTKQIEKMEADFADMKKQMSEFMAEVKKSANKDEE